MPMYTYRREDGTTFEIRQSFAEEPLQFDPQTGQPVHRVIQAPAILFKGSGFYVTDTKGASRNAAASNGNGGHGTSESKTDSQSNGSSNGTSESKAEPATTTSSVAADD